MNYLKMLTFFVFCFLTTNCGTVYVSTSDFQLLGDPAGSFVVENNLPYKGFVMVADKQFGFVAPGGTVFDRELVSFQGMEMPVAVALYDGKKCMGLAHTKLSMRSNRSSHWRINRVKWISGEKPNFSNSSEKVTGTSKKIELSRPVFKKTTMVQVGNATPYKGILEVNGRPVTKLNSCEVFYFSSVNIQKYSRSNRASIVLKLYDKNGELVGRSNEGRFSTSRSRPTAHQFIWGIRDIETIKRR